MTRYKYQEVRAHKKEHNNNNNNNNIIEIAIEPLKLIKKISYIPNTRSYVALS
jgi:hypothetical protein